MTVEVVRIGLNEDVPTGGTFTADIPDGYVASQLLGSKAHRVRSFGYDEISIAAGTAEFAFSSSTVTITQNSGQTYAQGTEIWVELDVPEDEGDDGFVAADGAQLLTVKDSDSLDAVAKADEGAIILALRDLMAYEVASTLESSPDLTTARGIKLFETGTQYSTQARFVAAVARGVPYVSGQVVHAEGRTYRFLDDGNTDISGLTGWSELNASADAVLAQAAQAAAETAQTAAQAAQAAAETARDNAQASALTLPTWTALAAITGSTAGEGAEVLDADSGTHTDPVVGGTVNNAGRYSWSASPAGWERIGNTTASNLISNVELQTVTDGPFAAGDRTADMNVTATSGILNNPSNLINGATGLNTTDSATFTGTIAAGNRITLAPKDTSQAFYVDRLTWTQHTTASHGVWKIILSFNGTEREGAANFTLGGATTQNIDIDPGYLPCDAIILENVSGSTSGAPYLQNVTLRTAKAPGYGTKTRDRLAGMTASLRAKLIAAFFFDEVEGDTVVDPVGGPSVDMSAPTSQSYAKTANGVTLTGGVIHLPEHDGIVARTIFYKANPGDLGTGFLVEGPNGSGALGTAPDSGAVEEQTLTAGQDWATVTANPVYTYDRGHWTGYYQERASYDGVVAIGGRATVTSSRVTKIEVGMAFLWNAALTTAEKADLALFLRREALRKNITVHFDDCHDERDMFIGIGSSMCEGVDTVANLSATNAAGAAAAGPVVLVHADEAGAKNDFDLVLFTLYGAHGEGSTDTLATAKTSPLAGLVAQRGLWSHQLGPAVALNLGKGSSDVMPSSTGASAAFSWAPGEARATDALYHTAIRAIQTALTRMVAKGIKPSKTLYMFWAYGLNAAVNTSYASSSSVYQGYLQALYDQLVSDLDYFDDLKVVMMRSHEDDAASNATALANVRAGTDAFIAANANVTLLDNDSNAYVDGVHNTADVMMSQGIAWHGPSEP